MNRIGAAQAYRMAMRVCLVVCICLIAASLYLWGAMEVREHFEEIAFLTFVGAVWLSLACAIFSWLGLSVRDDAVERKNLAALVALCCAMLAVTFTFAGGNLGEGPSYWNNVFSAAIGTGTLFGSWLVLELGARVSASVAEERDLASGLRLGGFLLAIGLIFGRAVAGDWHSMPGTVHDFLRDGWAGVVLLPVAALVERFTQPSVRRPFPHFQTCGLIPAAGYLAVAVMWLWHLGAWEGMPR